MARRVDRTRGSSHDGEGNGGLFCRWVAAKRRARGGRVRDGQTMILFEGNIAAGKSTVGRRLAESGLFGFIEEPVGAWQKDFEENLLDLFYRDAHRWAFTFQLAAFTTRAKTWTEVLAMTDHVNVILERSIYCDRYVFAKNCYQSGLMTKTE